MADSVPPPRFSTVIGWKVIPAVRTASPNWFSFLLWASLAAWPGSSAPMMSFFRAAVTVTGKWDQEIGRSSVEARKEEQCLPAWVEASRLEKLDEALSKSIVSGDRLPTCSTDKGMMTTVICRLVAGRALH